MYWSIICRPVPLNTQKLILLSYLSYLYSIWLLSEDSYLLEWLQSAEKKQKHTQKQFTEKLPIIGWCQLSVHF